MTKTGMATRAFTAAIMPALGVVPASQRLAHNSRRPAPPRAAASAESTVSTHASTKQRVTRSTVSVVKGPPQVVLANVLRAIHAIVPRRSAFLNVAEPQHTVHALL